MTKTVTLDRAALDAFCAQWPCHGFPEALDRIVFEFADNGDLVDITAYAARGRVIDSADFDGPALVALSQDAQKREGDKPRLRVGRVYKTVDFGAHAGFPVALEQHGPDNFAVRYGAQYDTGLDYARAAAKLGQALMHAAACDGKIDNRTKAEARRG